MASNTVKYEDFHRYLDELDWLEATLGQFAKDAQMAGTEPPDLDPRAGVQEVILLATEWTKRLMEDHSAFQSFNYRIDLPAKAFPAAMLPEDLATLYLFRCFQKVWLRRRFSEGGSKDADEISQKHLKP
jgi:inorganic triphosphatase YgiF